MLIRRKIGELRVSELRSELEKRNLDSKGLKGALLQRLQKAITEEGGDINQIEVEAVASPSAKIKNSPKVKKYLKTSGQSETDIKKAPSIAAETKSDLSLPSDPDNMNADSEQTTDDANAEKTVIDDQSTANPEKLEDVAMHEDTGNEGSSLEDVHQEVQEKEKEVSGQEGMAAPKDDYSEAHGDEHQDSVEDYDNERVENEENEFLVDNDTAKQYDDEDDEFVELVENCDEDNQAENYDDDIHAEQFQSNVEMNSGDEGIPDVKQTGENEANIQSADTTSTDYAEDADVGAEEPDEDSSNIAMEDDVLDMLDYDIEIPEQTSQDEGSKEGVSNDDGTEEGDVKAKVSGSSSETNIKDPSDKTESASEIKNKEGTDADDVKLSKNLWISGLSASTRASELKVAFSRYGKVVGAKVVTSARSPGTKCYGFVAMATLSAADKCILHLNKTELHGRVITVEHTKNDPSARKAPRSVRDDKNQSTDSKDSIHSAAARSRRSTSDARGSKSQAGDRTGDSSRGSLESGTRSGDKRPRRSASTERSRSRMQSSRGGHQRNEPYRKRPRTLDNRERKVVIDNKRGSMSLRVNVQSAHGGRKPQVLRRIIHSSQSTFMKFENRHASSRGRGRAPPSRPRDARDAIRGKKAEGGSRCGLPMALTASIERDRMLLQKEREERNYLRDEREKLERERRQLERDRLEREKLEHERIRLELERKRELEKIEREKREMKRLQEINRYELSQRQRALKRMHDDRGEKRVDRDDRRRFDPESRDRGGASVDVYRDDRAGMRPRGTTSGRIEGGRSDKSSYHDIDRRNMTHDTDARYGHSSSAAGGRRVEKYDRSGMKPAGDFGHERRGNSDNPRGSLAYRHQDKDSSDDRKVVPRDRGRPGNSGMKDIGPSGRGGSPGMSWKDGKSSSAGGSRSRPSDRDLREEIRQGSGHGGGSGRKPSDRGDHRHRDPSANRRSPSLPRSDSAPFERNQPDPGSHHNAPMAAGGNPIPTTGRNGMNSFQPSTTWPAWQERPESGNMWHGPRGPSGPMPGGAPVGRMLAPPMGAPFNSMNPMNPPIRMTGGMLGHGISPNYAPPDQRAENFKHIRRY